MSDETNAQSTPEPQPEHQFEEPAETRSAPLGPKRRNPVERILVWGLIIVMVAVAGIEATARIGYTRTLSRLQEEIAKDEGADAQPLHMDRVPGLISGFPTYEVHEGGIDSMVVYRWKGLFRDYGGIRIGYANDEMYVIGLMTDNPPVPEAPEIIAEAAEQQMAAEALPVDAGGGGEAGAGGGRFDPMQFDTDGDGRLSRDEAPERLLEIFDELDANGDGFLDAEELANRPRRGRGGRPPRPDSNPEEDAEP